MSSIDQATPAPAPAIESSDDSQVKGEDKVGRKVFIGNLAYTATEEELKSFVEAAEGTLESVELATRWNGRAAGYAFAVWSTTAEADAAVAKLDKQTLNEREIHVAIANGPSEKTPRQRQPKAQASQTDGEGIATAANDGTNAESSDVVPKKKRNNKKKRATRRLPSQDNDDAAPSATIGPDSTDDIHQADASTVAAGQDNTDEGQKKPRAKRSRKPKGPRTAMDGVVASEAARIDDAAPETDGAVAEGAADRASRRAKVSRPRVATTGEPSSTLIFVANLPFSVDDQQLSDMFTNLDIGIKSAKVITKPQTSRKGGEGVRSKGFGFVEAETHEQQTLALEKLQGFTIGEREVVVKVANERVPTEEAPTEENAPESKLAEKAEAAEAVEA